MLFTLGHGQKIIAAVPTPGTGRTREDRLYQRAARGLKSCGQRQPRRRDSQSQAASAYHAWWRRM